MLENSTQINNNIINTDKSITHLIKYPSINDGAEGFSREKLVEKIRKNIDYDYVAEGDRRQVDELVTLMADALCSPSPTVRINGTDVPKTAVSERFLQLDSEHIEYVLFAMERSKPSVRNIRAYLLTALYNAPATMDSSYAAAVREDLGM